MAEDFDLDRVIRDPAYRRRVIARLNLVADDGMALPEAENKDSVQHQAAQQPRD